MGTDTTVVGLLLFSKVLLYSETVNITLDFRKIKYQHRDTASMSSSGTKVRTFPTVSRNP